MPWSPSFYLLWNSNWYFSTSGKTHLKTWKCSCNRHLALGSGLVSYGGWLSNSRYSPFSVVGRSWFCTQDQPPPAKASKILIPLPYHLQDLVWGSFIHQIIKCVLSPYHVPSVILGAGKTAGEERRACLPEAAHRYGTFTERPQCWTLPGGVLSTSYPFNAFRWPLFLLSFAKCPLQKLTHASSNDLGLLFPLMI